MVSCDFAKTPDRRKVNSILKQFRPIFIHAAIFSFFINLAMLVPSLYMLQVFDRVLTSRSNETLLLLTLAAGFAMLIMFLLEVVRSRLLRGAGMLLDRKLGTIVLTALLDQETKPGSSPNIYGLKDAAALRNFLSGSSIIALLDTPWFPFYIALIFIFHPLMGVVALVGAGALLLLTLLNEKLTRKPVEAMQEASRSANRYIDTSLRNAEVVKAMGMRPAIIAHWQTYNQEVIRQQIESTDVSVWVSGSSKFIKQFLQMAMLGAGAYLVIDEHVTPGVMMASTVIMGRALAPLEGLLGSWKGLIEARAAYRRLSTQLKDIPENQTLTELPPPQGMIAMEKVYFHAKGSEKPIVREINFLLQSGESLGVIGPSASGKSSLARLLAGIWLPSTGTVRVDGADISTWPREQLGRYMGYMPQDIEMFPGTVSDNIARLTTPDSSDVIAAAQKAGAHEMILRLPQGYDTRLGEGGLVISGGQRQRIGLARALYRNPRILILDEPNSNLDAEGEMALLQAIRNMKQDKVTLIIITHKPSLLTDIDRVLVLREGNIELYGPRDAVLAKLLPQFAQQQKGAPNVA